MITSKKFSSAVIDGTLTRFLSDFIIPTEQHVRVYNYVHDIINGSDLVDILDPAGTGLYVRATDNPTSSDLQGLDNWDLVDNSILFYTAPPTTSSVFLEVATTPEEFGGTLVQPSVERAELAEANAAISASAALASETAAGLSESATAADVVLTHADVVLTNADVVLTHADVVLTHADAAATASDALLTSTDATNTAADVVLTHADVVLTNADVASSSISASSATTSATTATLKAWEAEAERLTAESYATEAEDVAVNIVTSDGDGTFTYTPTSPAEYSALHSAAKALSVVPAVSGGDNGKFLQVDSTGTPSWNNVQTFKNKLINGLFKVNQRVYVSGTATTTNNQYTLDMWRVVTLGQSLIFSETNGVVTVTAPLDGIEQITEPLLAGTYTFSKASGTATVTISESADNITYAPITPNANGSYTVTGYNYIKVNIKNGTATFVQLEKGSIVTPFEDRHTTIEELLCMYFFLSGQFLAVARAISTSTAYGSRECFPTAMRIVPTITLSNAALTGGTLGTITGSNIKTTGFRPTTTDSSGMTVGDAVVMTGTYTADASL